MRYRDDVLKIERALRNAESEMRDLIGVTKREYKPLAHEDGPIGTYKIYEVRYWMRQVRLEIRALKKEIKKHTLREG